MNTASEGSKSHHHYFLRFLGVLLVFAVGVAVGWGMHGLYSTTKSVTGMATAAAGKVGELLDKQHIDAVVDSLNKAKASALNSQQIEAAEKTLAALRAAAVKDGRIAALEVSLVSAKIGKALSDHQVDHARELLQKEKEAGTATPEQIKRWEEQIDAAARSSSSSSASASSPPPAGA